MKICCLSDIHGHLPKVPDCDLLLLGGDYCRDHKNRIWYFKEFAIWIEELSERMKIVGVAGNHDFIAEKDPGCLKPLRWKYLEDSGTTINGLNVYGSPWQLPFYDWAFNRPEEILEKKWAKIPDDTDILVLHGPPFGYGDISPYGNARTGSTTLTRRMMDLNLKLAVFGHIHSGYGIYKLHGKETILINAAYVNEKYEPANEPIIIDLEV